MSRRTMSSVAIAAVVALLATACSGSVGGDTSSSSASSGASASSTGSAARGGALADTINVGLEQTPGGYNCNTSASNSVYCAYVDNLTQGAFAHVQPDASIKPDPTFGTYEKTSDNPLTVKLTFSDKAVWSDGVPIDYDDVLLQWAALSGTHPNGENADGNPVDAFDAASTNGYSGIEMPKGAAGDRTVTFVFKEPYVDWEVLMKTTFMPAHIVAEQAGLSSGANGAELIKAITDNDPAQMKKIGAAWSTGFDFPVDLPTIPDPKLLPASGPYKIDNGSSGNLTLVRNDKWWGTEGKTAKFVYKLVNDQEWVQAMANGELDAYEPSNPSGDIVAQLKAAAPKIDYKAGEQYTFSHVDFNSGPGGGLENIKLRQAFLKCIPRQQLVDKYAKPVFEGAQILNLRDTLPAQGTYAEILAQVPSAKLYTDVDLPGAKALLAEAGVKVPYDIRLTYSSKSSLRADQVQVIKASCDQAGFNIVDKPDPDVFATLAKKDTSWDAAVFGWSGSGDVASGESIYVSTGKQNYGRYSSKIVDDAWAKAVKETDRKAAEQDKVPMEEELWANPYNAVLYANPGVAAFTAKVSGAGFNPTQSGMTWNAYEWTKAE